MHERKGNVLFSDGHVEESNDALLPSEETISDDLLYPDIVPSATGSSAGPVSEPGTGGSASPPGISNGNPSPQLGFNPTQSRPTASPTGGSHMLVSAVSSVNQSNGVGSNANPKMVAQPPSSLGSRKNITKTYSAPDDAQIPPAATGMVPAASGGGAIASDDPNRFMSPLNRHVARILQHFFLWGYLLLLLLLLLYLAYKLWRWLQKKEKKRQKARLEQAAQESTLDSDTLLR
jgi:prepilin-type processing-associated H-X9-DG protein